VRHLVVSPAQLEAVHGLLVFALQKHLVAQALGQVFGRFQGGLGRHVIDLGVENFDQVISGLEVWGGHVVDLSFSVAAINWGSKSKISTIALSSMSQ
jgi:hypothetical protein